MEFEGLEMGVLKVPPAKPAPAPSPTVPKLCLTCPHPSPHGRGVTRRGSQERAFEGGLNPVCRLTPP